VFGAGVILFDPIFQGLAISLVAGEIASLLISRMAVPVLYSMTARRLDAPVGRQARDDSGVTNASQPSAGVRTQ
jgi:hypothetical protein